MDFDTITPYPLGSCGRNGTTTVFIILSAITFFLITVLLPLRLFVRFYVKPRSFWWDDFCCVVAYFILVPYYSLLWRMVDRGLGRPAACVPRRDLVEVIELAQVTEFLQIIGTLVARLEVVLFVGHLFAVAKRARIFLWVYTIFMCVSMLATAILTFVVCYPVKALWHIEVGKITSCTGHTALDFRDYFNGAVGILTDSILALLPAYFMYNLEMSRSMKFKLSLLMALGFIPAGCCVTRTVIISQLTYSEPLKSYAGIVLFGGMEASMLIICGIIPTLRPLFVNSDWMQKLGKKPSVAETTAVPNDLRNGSEGPIVRLNSHQLRVHRGWSLETLSQHSAWTEAVTEVLNRLSQPGESARISR